VTRSRTQFLIRDPRPPTFGWADQDFPRRDISRCSRRVISPSLCLGVLCSLGFHRIFVAAIFPGPQRPSELSSSSDGGMRPGSHPGRVASKLFVNRVSPSAVSKRFAFPAPKVTCSWIFSLHGVVSVSFALICSSWLNSIFHRVLLQFGRARSPAVLFSLFLGAAYSGRFSLKRLFSSP
jgi:hypothetical protein